MTWHYCKLIHFNSYHPRKLNLDSMNTFLTRKGEKWYSWSLTAIKLYMFTIVITIYSRTAFSMKEELLLSSMETHKKSDLGLEVSSP